MNYVSNNVFRFDIAVIAYRNGITYGDLIKFIKEYRMLPYFQYIIEKHQLEELIYGT